jgi:hypothetical protein
MTSATVLTYTSLVEDVMSYLERTDDATRDKVPTFIMLAESKLANEIKVLGQQQVVQGNFTQGNAVLQKPARWRKTVSMNYVDATGKRTPILLRKYEYLRNYWPDAVQENPPKFYCDYDYDHWLIAPTPDDTYSFEVLYYERLQPLSSTNQTNWLTQNCPQAMLYGTLLEAMPFLKNDERMPLWQQSYDRILASLKSEDFSRIADRQQVVTEGKS